MKATREKFERLQAKWKAANEAELSFRRELKMKYGEVWKAPRGKENRLQVLAERESKAMDKLLDWLDSNSPRNWHSGCPVYFIMEELSYDDAVTSGQLSVVPPAPYGYSNTDMVHFSRAVA